VEGYCLPERQPENQVFRSFQDGFEEGMSADISEGSQQGPNLSGKAVILEMFCREKKFYITRFDDFGVQD